MINEDPTDFRPRVSKGLLYQLKGNSTEAEEQFAKVMELLPADFPEREAVVTMIETARRQVCAAFSRMSLLLALGQIWMQLLRAIRIPGEGFMEY
jgi:cytochrome c-type biogenesis protein CcmH/NrfG